MKLSVATVIAVLVAAALLVAGCGGGGSESAERSALPPRNQGSEGGPGAGGPKKATAPNAPAGSKVILCKGGAGGAAELRATAISCGIARNMMSHWENKRACAQGIAGGRGSCSVGGYRCQAVKVDRGISVSCARKGADIAFIAEG